MLVPLISGVARVYKVGGGKLSAKGANNIGGSGVH
jgi:hypothetical protein